MGIISVVLQIDDGFANPRAWVGKWGGFGGQKSHMLTIYCMEK